MNKQLDLQTLVIQVGREIAQAGNWYQQRRLLQGLFVGVLGSGLLSALLLLVWKRRRFFQQHLLTLPGSILLVSYILLRAAAIDHVGEMVGVQFEHGQWLAGLEISGIMCFIGASIRIRPDAKQKLKDGN